jgi:hypothetical protein
MKNGQMLKLGDAHVTPRNIQEVQASKLGDAPEAPPSSSAKTRSPFKTLYFYCFMHYAFFLERQLFLLSVFFCFVCCNKWLDHIMLFLEERNFTFHLPRTLRFSLLSFQRVFSFSRTPFSLHFFALIFVQILFYLCIKVYLDLWYMLIFLKRVSSKRFEWCWKREKVSCKKVVQKGACLDWGLDFCMSCLMSF